MYVSDKKKPWSSSWQADPVKDSDQLHAKARIFLKDTRYTFSHHLSNIFMTIMKKNERENLKEFKKKANIDIIKYFVHKVWWCWEIILMNE